MNSQSDKYLEYMKEKFIKEGYFNNGVVSGRSIKNRIIINDLLEKGLIVRRKCILEAYELNESIRTELIKKYDLHKAWGKNYKIFKANI
ncbi:hypothetical protein EQZ09_00705 [Clostridium perfringens]|nr:hypothetical protein [Clostridium perfringens]